jgi:phosphoenolpyruvate-protein kinase (PTS system EI component)
MVTKKEETASFVLRLSQKIYKNDDNEPQIQWRGNIRHVQSGDETRFSTFDNATEFVQSKLADLTLKAVEDKTEDEQKGIISKSFDFWKKVAAVTPKLVIDSIKDPKKQAAQLQDQIQEQIHQFSDSIEHTLEERKSDLDNWLGASKSDSRKIVEMLGEMSAQITALNQKVDELSKQNKVRIK